MKPSVCLDTLHSLEVGSGLASENLMQGWAGIRQKAQASKKPSVNQVVHMAIPQPRGWQAPPSSISLLQSDIWSPLHN